MEKIITLIHSMIVFPVFVIFYYLMHLYLGFEYSYNYLFKVRLNKMSKKKFDKKYRFCDPLK